MPKRVTCRHPFFNNISHRKKIQQSLARTTGIVMIDDPEISKLFSEFLLSVQGRLMSGSNKEGMSAPRAAALISTNSPELARYEPRNWRIL